MYYVVNGVEAATMEGIVNTINRMFDRINRRNPEGLGEWLEVIPFTEKGTPSTRYNKFTIHVNIYNGDKTIFIYGGDSLSHKVYSYTRNEYEYCFTDIYARVYYID